MSDNTKKKKDSGSSKSLAIWIGVLAGTLVLVLAVLFFVERAYVKTYEGRIFPGVRVLGVRLDGLTSEEARQELNKAIDARLAQGLRFMFQGQEKILDVIPPSTGGPDVTFDLLRYDVDAAIAEAMRVGRGGGWQTNVAGQFGARLKLSTVPANVEFDVSRLETSLRQAFQKQIVASKNASFSIVMATGSGPFVSIVPETTGVDFDAAKAIEILKIQAQTLDFKPILLEEVQARAVIRRQDLEPLRDEAAAFARRPSLTFTYEERSFSIPTSTMMSWIAAAREGDKIYVTLDPNKVAKTLKELAPDIEKEAVNGSLNVIDGKIQSFMAGTQGAKIKIDETLKTVLVEWPFKTVFPLVVEITPATLVGDDPARLGIKEIIGVGRSNYAGSPTNRRKNIRKGIEKVNGTLIAPGGEFSLLKTLGSIDGVNGWLPELVIKGDRTIPEFGGGLCQIGTTTFRGALNSGLKITQRRNHAYRVRYYEPAGTDATIYEPSPDFRFMNDTNHHVLINAYSEGDEVVFEFWGTKDGRKVEPIKPRIYNITSPPPTKLIETVDLPPGQKKCTETAHAGADAEFTYKITYGDGQVHEEVFKSHYRPWQAVCLVGVEKLSEPESVVATEPVTALE